MAVMVCHLSLGGGVSVSPQRSPLLSSCLGAQFSSHPPLFRPGPKTDRKQQNILVLEKKKTMRLSP